MARTRQGPPSRASRAWGQRFGEIDLHVDAVGTSGYLANNGGVVPTFRAREIGDDYLV